MATKYNSTNTVTGIESLVDAPGGGGLPASVFFGAGTDGDVTISADTTLTRTMYYNTLVVGITFTLANGGFPIFVKETLTNNGTISRDGPAGKDAVGATAGAATGSPAACNDFYMTPAASLAGGNGSVNNGADGSLAGVVDKVVGGAGGNGGNAGAGGTGTGGAGTAGATVNSIYRFQAIAMILSAPQNIAALPSSKAGSGGGGGGDTTNSGGGGGAGGGGPGAVYICAKTIINGGKISADGGRGGHGANGVGGNAGGGGGGGGAGGGLVMLIYSTLTGAGTVTSAGGAKGNKGTGVGTGVDGTDGTAGAAGIVLKFDLTTGTVT